MLFQVFNSFVVILKRILLKQIHSSAFQFNISKVYFYYVIPSGTNPNSHSKQQTGRKDCMCLQDTNVDDGMP